MLKKRVEKFLRCSRESSGFGKTESPINLIEQFSFAFSVAVECL